MQAHGRSRGNRAWALFASDCHDVGSSAEDRGFAFHFADHRQQALALQWITPQALEIAGQPAWTLDGRDCYYFKTRCQYLAGQRSWPMQKRIGEIHGIPGGITVLAAFQVSCNDGGKLRIVKKAM